MGFYGIPAFVGPYAFQIQRMRESFVIVGNEVASSFTEIMHGNRAHGRQLKREIDPMIAGRVHTIWKTFLSECRFPTAEDVDGEGMDRAEYYFTARTEFGGASGTTWSPDKSRNPRLYLLVSLAGAVFAHLKDDSIDTTEIESLLTQLEKSN